MAGSQRVPALDTLRGLAIFGILIVNVNQLFEPVWIANSPVGLVRDQVLDETVWFFSDAFITDKFLALFSLLFGAGFALQWSRASGDDEQFRRIYRRRLAWLAVFGICHALFLYMADVLVIYALAGSLLFLMRRWSARALLLGGVALWTLTLLWQMALHSSGEDTVSLAAQHQVLIDAIDRTRTAGAAASDIVQETARARPLAILLSGSELERALLEHRAFAEGPLGLTLLQRAGFFALLMVYTALYLLWRTLGLFMIAAGLVKLGVLAFDRRAQWVRAAWVGAALGLPLTVLATWLRYVEYQTVGGAPWIGSTLHELAAALLATAIAATVVIWCSTSRAAPLQRGFAAVGRTALTNYLGQSAIVSLIACWYGLGLYGQLTRAEQFALACALFTGQILVSRWWLARYQLGPLEWVWRTLTYRRRVQLRRAGIARFRQIRADRRPAARSPAGACGAPPP